MWSVSDQGSRMRPIYAQDRSALRSEGPPFAGFYRVSAPLTSPKLPSHRIADLHAFALGSMRAAAHPPGRFSGLKNFCFGLNRVGSCRVPGWWVWVARSEGIWCD